MYSYKPSTALNQQITYSLYYAGNRAKGGMFLQCCRWMSVQHLLSGAVSDSNYMIQVGAFKA